MANQVVQLTDKDNNNIFPVAGSMAGDSVETSMIKDEAVTSSKIDWTTFVGNNTYTLSSGFSVSRGGIFVCGKVVTVALVIECTETKAGNVAVLSVNNTRFNGGVNTPFKIYEGSDEYTQSTQRNGYLYYANVVLSGGATAGSYYLIEITAVNF